MSTTPPGAAIDARTMTDAAFAEAMRTRGWRATPSKPKPAAEKPALGMTDEQFTEALRTRAWRKKDAT